MLLRSGFFYIGEPGEKGWGLVYFLKGRIKHYNRGNLINSDLDVIRHF